MYDSGGPLIGRNCRADKQVCKKIYVNVECKYSAFNMYKRLKLSE